LKKYKDKNKPHMAIYHYHRSIGKRSEGKNAVFAAAYIRGEKRTCDRTGITNDFSDKTEVIYTNTFLPDDAPLWARDLSNKIIVDDKGNKQHDESGLSFSTYAWNQIEFSERRVDSRLYFHDDIALPKELNREQAIGLVNEFVKSSLSVNGVFCDVAIHWETDNPHLHVLMPMRTLTEEGFSKKIRFTKPQLIQEIKRVREAWSVSANQTLQSLGLDERIDHRSYKARGINLTPTVKIGKFNHLDESHINDRKVTENELIKQSNALSIQKDPTIVSVKLLQEKMSFNEEDIKHEMTRYLTHSTQNPSKDTIEKPRDAVLETMLASIHDNESIFNAKALKNKLRDNIDSEDERERIYKEIISHESIYSLGLGEDGRQHFVGNQAFHLEKSLLRDTHFISTKNTFKVSKRRVREVGHRFGLNQAQQRALLYMTRSGNISVVCGYAGTGKTYMMKAAKTVWDEAGFTVMGLSMSGKAVSGLESDTGIESKTIHSFLQAIKNKTILIDVEDIKAQHLLMDKKLIKQPKPIIDNKTILVMDEMGMTSLDDMQAVIEIARKTGAKFAGVGDIEQTQPVGRGAPFRAMVGAVGAVYLDDIIRQNEAWMRDATMLFETNQTAAGFALYEERGFVHLHKTDLIAMKNAVDKWHEMTQHPSDVQFKDCMITAFKNETVDSLNLMARHTLNTSGALESGVAVSTDFGQINIAVGERLLFTKNDYTTQVKNGDFATVLALNEKTMRVQLDSGKTVDVSLEKFKQFKYGYAATVHKLQGYTGKHINVLIDGEGWDRHKFLVAATRHKVSLTIHASNDTFASLTQVKDSVSRHGLNDILYDFPVAYAERRGFDVNDSAIKACGLIQKSKAKLVDAVGFLFNYQSAIEQGESGFAIEQDVIAKRRQDAVLVAEFSDNRVELAMKLELLNSHPDTEKPIIQREIYALQLRNGEIATQIKANPAQFTVAVDRNRIRAETLDTASLFHARYERVKSLVEVHPSSPMHHPELAFQVMNDIKAHFGHVCHLIEDKATRNAFLSALEQRADIHRRETALDIFGVAHRALINTAMRYKALDHEVGTLLKETNLKDKQSLYEASTTRDKLAADLKASPNFDAIATHFAIKSERVDNHAQKYQDRLFVKAFAALPDSSRTCSNLAKQAAAHRIKGAPKQFGIFIDECLPDGWKSVNLENWLFERRQMISSSSPEFKQSLQRVQRYKMAASSSYQQWQKAIERNKRGSPHATHGFKQAQGMTWARSLLAHVIIKNLPKHVAALSLEKVDTIKLYQQSIQVDYLQRYRTETRDTLKLHMANYIHDNLNRFQAGLAVYGLYQDVKERAAHGAYLKRVKNAPNAEMKVLIRLALDYQEKKVEAGTVWGQVKTLQQLKINTRGLEVQAKQLLTQRNKAAHALLEACTNTDSLSKESMGIHLNVASLQREAKQYQSHQTVLHYLSSSPDARGALAKEMLANKAGFHLLFEHNISFETLKQDVLCSERNTSLPHALSTQANTSNKKIRWDIDKITHALMQHPVETYTAILGKPKEHNATHLRYPNGLIISIKGTDAGKWYSFTEEVGGTPLSAIQKYLGLSFSEALAQGASLADLSDDEATLNDKPIIVKHPEPTAKLNPHLQNGIVSAQSIWDGTVSVDGTLAARYFSEHRGVESLDGMEIRFWPKDVSWVECDAEGARIERLNKIPAAVIAARNAQGQVVSVQRIYLDENTAGKNTYLQNAKLTKGSNKGAPGVIQTGQPGGTLYLAEGPETAASIASLNKHVTVLTSFSVSNIANMAEVIKTYAPDKVIIAADNDGLDSSTRLTTEKACETLKNQGIDARIAYPPLLADKNKTDWNDVLVNGGMDALSKAFHASVSNTQFLYEKSTPIQGTLAEVYFEHHKETLDIADVRFTPAIPFKGQQVPAMMVPRRNAQGVLCGETIFTLSPDGRSILSQGKMNASIGGFYTAQQGKGELLCIADTLMNAKIVAAKNPNATVVLSRVEDFATVHAHMSVQGVKPAKVLIFSDDYSRNKQISLLEHVRLFHADGAALALMSAYNTPEAKTIKFDPVALEKSILKKNFEQLIRKKPEEHHASEKPSPRAALEKLKKTYPVLSQYDHYMKQSMKASLYDKEILEKKLLSLATEMACDKQLMQALKRDVPKAELSIQTRIANSKKRGIKH
jgi:Ti-type conjugative transfer relaxase TraA